MPRPASSLRQKTDASFRTENRSFPGQEATAPHTQPSSYPNNSLYATRDISNHTALTKEEQLLGYSSQERQRVKALQILGLTEESFERCRAVMLSSLGPSAFGYTADETAKSAARAEAEEGWTPGDKFRRKGPGGDGSGLLRMPTFGNITRYGDEQFN